MHTTALPPISPAPRAPLPALPLQAKAPAPPPTPRNAGQLYGEFSWPSLDVATLVERLEDLAEGSDGGDSLALEHTTSAIGYSETRCSSAGECICEDGSPAEDFLVKGADDVEVTCLGGEGEVSASTPAYDDTSRHSGIAGRVAEDTLPKTDSAFEDLHHTCLEGEDEHPEFELLNADDDTNDESGFLGSRDWAELLGMLGWLGGFDGEAQEQLLELNERPEGEKRWGVCVDDDDGYEG